jgi:imidazolonepropionase-like amidohydrolase
LLIINARIYTIENGIIENGWLETNDDRIRAFGKMQDVPQTAGESLDAKGGILMPGLIDAHTHLGMWEDGLGFEGDDGNEETDPSTPHLSALDAINPLDRCFEEALSAGVTTVVTGPGSANPIGGQLVAIKTYGKRIDDMVIKNPIAIKFALGENPKMSYHAKNETPVTRMGTAAIIREQLYKAQKYMQKLEDAVLDDELEEPEFDYKCEALIPLLKREIQAHFHAHRADDIFTAIRIGKEFSLDYAIIHCTEGHLIAEELLKDNVKIFSGPYLCDRCKPELRNQTPQTAGLLSAAGIEPAIITDHPVVPAQYLTLCAALAVKHGLGYEAALRAITIIPAKLLGLDKDLGSLVPGKIADLVLFDGDPLSLMTNVIFVMVGGRRVK